MNEGELIRLQPLMDSITNRFLCTQLDRTQVRVCVHTEVMNGQPGADSRRTESQRVARATVRALLRWQRRCERDAELRRYKNLMCSVVRKYTRDQHDFDDMLQDVATAVFRALGRYDPRRARKSTFIVYVARNEVRNSYRRRRRIKKHEVTSTEGDESTAKSKEEDPLCNDDTLRKAIQLLSEDKREILNLALRGHSNKAIASHKNKTEGAIRAAILRTVKDLHVKYVELEARSRRPGAVAEPDWNKQSRGD